MAKPNLLLCSPSPRDIQQVYDELKQCPYDRLYAKYFPEIRAYNLMRDYFLSHSEYDYLVICPDDLVIKKENVDRLATALELNPFDVLSGVCNVDMGENKDFITITHNLPHPTRWVAERGQIGWRCYQWFTKDEKKDGIAPVKFSGFACEALSREIMTKIKFQDDSSFNNSPDMMTGAIDVMFANQCFSQRPFYPQMVDFGNRMQHLKLQSRFSDIQIGDGELRFYKKHKDMFEMIFKEPLGLEKVWQMHPDDKVIEGMIKDDAKPQTPSK